MKLGSVVMIGATLLATPSFAADPYDDLILGCFRTHAAFLIDGTVPPDAVATVIYGLCNYYRFEQARRVLHKKISESDDHVLLYYENDITDARAIARQMHNRLFGP